MSMNAVSLGKSFSVERLALLLRNRVIDEAPVVGIGAAIILANNLISLLLVKSAFFNVGPSRTSLWSICLILGGLLLAGGAFKGMHDGKAGTEWILLPATSLEKYGAALVDLALVYPIAASILCAALSALLSLVVGAIGGQGGRVWLPLDLASLKAWGEYAIAVAVLLAGSASFRKAPLIKTAGLFVAYVLAVLALCALGLWAARGFGSVSLRGDLGFANGSFSFYGAGVSARAERIARAAFDVASYALLPAFAVLFGAAKVAEKEGRDEVQ
jgi:hypothetical protein